jgi:hypothetical protein
MELHNKYQNHVPEFTMIYQSAYINYFMNHTSERVQNNVDRARQQMGWPLPNSALVIGMHVRWGDKVFGKQAETKMVHIQTYVDEVARLHRMHGASHMFITSDDSSAIVQAIKLIHDTKLPIRVMFDPSEVRQPGINTLGKTPGQLENLGMDAGYEGLNAVKVLKLPSSCDFLIGSARSTVFKVAYNMKYLHNKHFMDVEGLTSIP